MARLPSPIPLLMLAAGCMYPTGLLSHYDGTATIGWTIAGRHDAEACAERNASFVRIVVRFDLDEVTADDVVTCSTMVRRYVLDRGWYSANLTLLDASRAPVSDTLGTGSFYVSPGGDTFAGVDFGGPVIALERAKP